MPAGYLVFCGQLSQQFPTRSHVYVRVLDFDGDVQGEFEHRIGDDRDFDLGYIDPVAIRPDGTFACGISEGYGYAGETWLYTFGLDGDTLARTFLYAFPPVDSTIDVIRQTRHCSDGGSLLVGALDLIDELAHILLVRVGEQGDTLWTAVYGGLNEAPVALGVAEYTDGGFLLTGYGTPPGNLNMSFLIRTDANGNQLWRRNYGNHAAVNGAVRVAADGGIITWSEYREDEWPNDWQQMMLTKWNAAGGVVWQRRSHLELYTSTYDFEVLPDGSFIASGTSRLNGVLTKLSGTGDSLWSRTYSFTHDFHLLYDVEPTSDGGFVATGTAYRYEPLDPQLQTNQIIWVVKTDSLGCVVPGCQNVGVREYALDMNEYLQVWPNPVGDVLNFSFAPPAELMPTGAPRATLLDATGRVVREEAFAPNTSSFTLTTGDLALGAYHLHLTDGQRWLAGRTVVKE